MIEMEAPMFDERYAALRAAQTANPYEIYAHIDLGPGGYARAPARQAKRHIKTLLEARCQR